MPNKPEGGGRAVQECSSNVSRWGGSDRRRTSAAMNRIYGGFSVAMGAAQDGRGMRQKGWPAGSAKTSPASRRAPKSRTRDRASATSSTMMSRWNCCGRSGSGHLGGLWFGASWKRDSGGPIVGGYHDPVAAVVGNRQPQELGVEGRERAGIGAVDNHVVKSPNHDLGYYSQEAMEKLWSDLAH